jgi:dTDP-L-rhamnose 4-epimerase
MKILVTGGAGFIGSHLIDLLVSSEIETVVLDNLDPQVHGRNAMEPTNILDHVRGAIVRFVRGDVRDRQKLVDSLEGVDTVVHLAAAVGVGQSMYQPDYYTSTNCAGTGLLLDVLAGAPQRIRKLIVASSMSLYGEGAYHCTACGGVRPRDRDDEQLKRKLWEPLCADCGKPLAARPTPESKTPDIKSIYAATKKHQEDLFVAFGRAYQIPTFALRFFNVFGPRQSLSNPYTGVAAIFLSRLLNKRSPLIFEDGRQTRDFIDVRDIAAAILKAIEYSGHGAHVLNVGTGKATSIVGVARLLARHLGVDVQPTLLDRYRAGDVRHCFSDTTRMREVLGCEPRWSLESGLSPLVEWSRAQRAEDKVEAGHSELAARGLVR